MRTRTVPVHRDPVSSPRRFFALARVAPLCLLLATQQAMAEAPASAQKVSPPLPTNRGVLRLSEESFDFGCVAQNTRVAHTYVLRNTGDDTLFIHRVQPTCGCTSAPLAKNKLAPGDKVPLDVTFNSGKFSGHTRKTVTIHSSDGKAPMTSLDFSALVGSLPDAVGLEPPAGINLSQFAATGSPESKAALTNQSPTGTTVRIVSATPAFLEARLSATRLAPREAADLIVRAREGAPPGRFYGSVTVLFEGGGNTRLSIPVTGERAAP